VSLDQRQTADPGTDIDADALGIGSVTRCPSPVSPGCGGHAVLDKGIHAARFLGLRYCPMSKFFTSPAMWRRRVQDQNGQSGRSRYDRQPGCPRLPVWNCDRENDPQAGYNDATFGQTSSPFLRGERSARMAVDVVNRLLDGGDLSASSSGISQPNSFFQRHDQFNRIRVESAPRSPTKEDSFLCLPADATIGRRRRL